MNLKVLSLLVAVLLYNLFFFRMPWGISFFALMVGLNTLVLVSKRHPHRVAIFFSLTSSVVALLASATSNEFLRSLDTGTAWSFLALAILYAYAPKPPVLSAATLVAGPFLTFLQYISQVLFQFLRLGALHRLGLSGRTITVLRGLVLGGPVVLILYGLLASADPIFSKISGDVLKDIGPRTFHTLLFVTLILPIIATWAAWTLEIPQTLTRLVARFATEFGIILFAVLVLFAGFLIVQYQYVFHTVPEVALVKFGVATYSEYVRKGFLQLLVAATLTYGLVAMVVWLNSQRQGGLKWIQWLNTVVVVEVLALIAANAKRVYLYQMLHGLTRIRVFGSLFLLWLALMVLLLLYRNWFRDRRNLVILFEIIITVAVLGFSHWLNVDYQIANRFPPTVNKEVDYLYISRLSYDAAEGWLPALAHARKTIELAEAKKDSIDTDLNRKLYYTAWTLGNIRDRVERLQNKYGQKNWPWQGYNLREYEAWQYINKHPEFWETERLSKRLAEVQKFVSPTVVQSTRYDRSQSHPLLGD